MKITWHGQSCFKLLVKSNNGGKITILIDPFDKETGLNPPRGGADIVLITHNHHDHNNLKTVSGTPFVINGPGEYDTKGVPIKGIYSYHDNSEGSENGVNTIYVIEAENMQICHLGDLGQKELTDEQLDKMGEIDILMVPVGGTWTIDGEGAVKIINQIEPSIAIPMHYKIPGINIKLEKVDDFLKEIGVQQEIVDEFDVKKLDLGEDMKVVVMKPL
ncbi:MAG TPA: MBL fold metallo-hydrolase [Candidatus Paceibacterota bacterium]|nr:MBL fold metallo-hydrolase [Candidatus Paceibacterota bacterium]